MSVALWAEIRRLSEIEQLSQRAIARRLRCCRRTVKKALALDRPRRGRADQEVFCGPGEAMQVDWSDCGRVPIGGTQRRGSVFVAVSCYNRLCHIEFSLARGKADFSWALIQALEFFGGRPRKIIFDNHKAAILNGSDRSAYLQPVAGKEAAR